MWQAAHPVARKLLRRALGAVVGQVIAARSVSKKSGIENARSMQVARIGLHVGVCLPHLDSRPPHPKEQCGGWRVDRWTGLQWQWRL